MWRKEEHMPFENLIPGLFLDREFLSGSGAFHLLRFRDRNPLGGTTKIRKLEAPNEPMRIVHRALLRYLRGLSVDMPYATACRAGDSPLKNVERHKANRYFYLVDLCEAYRNVDGEKLTSVLIALDPRLRGRFEEVRAFLTRYCLSRFGGLPIGAPASPDLFNFYCAELIDKRVAELCRIYGFTYTRYLDDLTISGTQPISRRVRKQVRDIIKEAGFQVNHPKAEVKDLAKGTITVNGVGLEMGGRIFVPRFFTRHIRGLLLRGIQGDISLQPKISGAMGVFLGTTDRQRLNATEQKILTLHRKFRRLVRKKRK